MNKDFELKKLSEVCNFQNGFAFKSNTFKDSGTPVIRITNIKNDIIDTSNVVYINPLDYDKDLSKYEIKNNDLLIAMSGATTGKIGIYKGNEKLLLNQRVGNFKPKDKLSKEYLFYFLLTKVEENLAISAGSAQPNLSTLQINNFMLPLFNLDIQKQIVEILDKAFESIEQAKVNIEKNIENTKELFQSRLNEIFSQKGDGWEEKKLGKVCKTGAGGTPLKSKKEYYENGNIPWLCSGEVKQGNIYSSNKFITQKGLDNSSAKLFPKDTVVIAMYGATAGDVGILRFETSTNQAVCGILPNDILIPEFIYYSFSYRKNELIAQATGNAQPNISQIKIKNTLIPILEKKEQLKIIEELDSLKEQTKQLENHYKQKLKNLEELKKSILQKAFSGELLNDS